MTALPWQLLPDNSTVGDDGRLRIAGCDTIDLAREFGTPLFVYDEDHLRERCHQAVAAFGDGAVYASKAFLCLAMARLAHEEGMRIDVATEGEAFVALQAGVPAQRLVFHGNNKSRRELEMALDSRVGRLVVDGFAELDRIEELVGEGHPVPAVFLRVAPGVEAHTHEYLATGQDDSKFGFTVANGDAARAVERVRASPAFDLRGIHCHIGSQVYRVESYAEALRTVAGFAAPFGLGELAIGGGLGVAYVAGETAPGIAEWAATVREAARSIGLGSALWAEPGRAIVAAAAVTLYEVGSIKEIPGIRTYVAVDGGMSDNPRPVLYGSGYEAFLPRAVTADRTRPIRLVGKHCESGDVLIRDGFVPADLAVGDIVATPVTGAYGHSMGSNYNKMPRPAVVFARSGDARVVVRRESPEDLIRNDV
ncbi:MAG TPA: diaminopimelate decarboxylase [Actinobacteria bacterium]|nr:diaminopimelate decarboxylase [Actinomycetota bacterium]